MPVKIDQSGRRSVETEVEVPGTPEEVWKAIATGPGISSWFVPSTVEGRVGGATTADFGFGPDAIARADVTVWNPPQRFVAQSRDDMGPGGPAVATEWIVEARSGGTCIVRVVHSWVTDSDKWDDQFEGHSHGWKGFFKILRLYLTHFAGQPAATAQFLPTAPEPTGAAWATLTHLLGMQGVRKGDRVTSAAGAPPLAGVVEEVGDPPHSELLLLKLDRPTPGIAHLFALAMGGQVFLTMRLFLFGPQAAKVLPEQERIWQSWISERLLPAVSPRAQAGT
jgi:uncharacterized protein YndB with AHSA1/START domain